MSAQCPRGPVWFAIAARKCGFQILGKSGPRCGVCASEHRHSVDLGLVRGMSMRALGLRFNLSADAIGRHAKAHLSPAQRAALLTASAPAAIDLDALQASESSGLLAQLVGQRGRLQSYAEMAADLGDTRAAISAEQAITSNLALVGKLLGTIVQRHDVRHTNLLVSPDYLRLRETLVQALKEYPAAAQAAGRALYALESQAATDITTAAGKGRAPALIEHEAAPPLPEPPK